ncbi:hypothetical protein ACTG0T_13405 [Halococcus morrhuae DSM 1307]|uniref:hypothetical protein n=1 Tax=Halococcus morrhuae TaxID=2250 RepID=UPI001873032B|nr:hypothetical protein [Halococcus morrhuae]
MVTRDNPFLKGVSCYRSLDRFATRPKICPELCRRDHDRCVGEVRPVEELVVSEGEFAALFDLRRWSAIVVLPTIIALPWAVGGGSEIAESVFAHVTAGRVIRFDILPALLAPIRALAEDGDSRP